MLFFSYFRFWAVRYIKLAISSAFERTLSYPIVSYRIVSYLTVNFRPTVTYLQFPIHVSLSAMMPQFFKTGFHKRPVISMVSREPNLRRKEESAKEIGRHELKWPL